MSDISVRFTILFMANAIFLATFSIPIASLAVDASGETKQSEGNQGEQRHKGQGMSPLQSLLYIFLDEFELCAPTQVGVSMHLPDFILSR